MNISEIKSAIGSKHGFQLGTLNFVSQFEQGTDAPTEWLSHWDNDHRVRVTAHQDIISKLKENPQLNTLAMKSEVVPATAERAAYARYVLIILQHIELAI